MAKHPSTHRLHSDSFPARTTRAELHGIPRQEGREADLAMAVADFVKSAGESFRVGWKIDSNWTDPVLFATYQVIRPLASLLIVAFIVIIGASVGAAANSAFYSKYLAWLIVGNAFYAFVLQIMLGMAILVHVDRTRYEVLKNIYISPGTLHPYVIGRGLVSVVNGAVSVILTLLFSVAIFNGLLHMNIPLNLLNVNLLPSRGSHLPNSPPPLVCAADLKRAPDNLLAQCCSGELRSLTHGELRVRSCLLGPDDACYNDHWDYSVQAGRAEGQETRTL